jgi:phage terminase small subunit
VSRNLNEKQQLFMQVLFDEAQGDVVQAKKLAGYSDGTATRVVIEGLKDEIFEATKTYMSRLGPKAAVAYGSALMDPTQLGIKEKMAAAGQILDRAGVVKTEKVAVEASGGLFILPPKESNND